MSILSRLRQKYARVIVVVGATARLKRGAQLQGATLADVAAQIESFNDFSRLCREDLRDAWFNDSEHKGPRTVYNRCETWERLYRHWHAARGTSNDPLAIDISAADGAAVIKSNLQPSAARPIAIGSASCAPGAHSTSRKLSSTRFRPPMNTTTKRGKGLSPRRPPKPQQRPREEKNEANKRTGRSPPRHRRHSAPCRRHQTRTITPNTTLDLRRKPGYIASSPLRATAAPGATRVTGLGSPAPPRPRYRAAKCRVSHASQSFQKKN